jgi:hypothetical protein
VQIGQFFKDMCSLGDRRPFFGLPAGASPEQVGAARMSVRHIASGPDVLVPWLTAVLNGTQFRGHPAHEVGIQPEQMAGSDCMIAAVHEQQVTILSYACTWSDGPVDSTKVKDQQNKVPLENQFQAICASKAPNKKSFQERRQCLMELLHDPLHQQRLSQVCVLVELPGRRKGASTVGGVEHSVIDLDGHTAIVVDASNAAAFFGVDFSKFCT